MVSDPVFRKSFVFLQQPFVFLQQPFVFLQQPVSEKEKGRLRHFLQF
jgi:hypothetical protein